MYEEKQKEYNQKGFIAIAVMLCLFCVLKVIRGADTTLTTEGGIWNYISLAYYVVAFLGITRHQIFKVKAMFTAPLLYALLSMFFALGAQSVSTSFSKIYAFLMIPYFFLVFISFYFYTGNSLKAENIILLAYVICLLVNAYTILAFLIFGRNRAMANDVYYSLCLLPFVLQLVKHKGLKIAAIFAQFFVTFLSNKRTGFIALCIGLILYFILETSRDSKKSILKVLGRIFIIIAVIWVLYYVSTYVDNKFGFGIYARLNRLETDEGSGRGRMYLAVWNEIKNSSWFEILFGHGMNTAGRVAGAGYAHNDFLEVFYDYGIFSFLCIVIYYFTIIRYAITMVLRKSPYASAFAFSVVIGLSLSLFSYFLIFYTFVTCIVAFWGYIIKLENQRLEQLDTIKEVAQ